VFEGVQHIGGNFRKNQIFWRRKKVFLLRKKLQLVIFYNDLLDKYHIDMIIWENEFLEAKKKFRLLFSSMFVPRK